MEQTNGTECGALRAVNINITVVVWGTGTSISEELEASNYRPASLLELFLHIIVVHPQL
jgi:acetylglutamate kinase